jgi:hypothetical protein
MARTKKPAPDGDPPVDPAAAADDARARVARLTAIVPIPLAERLRNAVDALQGPPMRLRLTAALERAVQVYVEQLERKYSGGQPFPQRPDAPLPKA